MRFKCGHCEGRGDRPKNTLGALSARPDNATSPHCKPCPYCQGQGTLTAQKMVGDLLHCKIPRWAALREMSDRATPRATLAELEATYEHWKGQGNDQKAR